MADHSHSRLFSASVLTVNTWMCIYFFMWSSCCYTAVTESQVMGSSQPVMVKVGDEAILPCHVDPPVNMEKKTLEWSRPDLKPRFVLLRQDGRYITDVQNQVYKQRTSLFEEELSRGNISLKLFSVKLSDEGNYTCLVPTLHSSSLIQLLVGSVSQPEISSNGPTDGGVSLSCDSGCWYPEPEMSWLDADGNNIPAEPSVTRSSQRCYEVQRNVMVTQAGQVTCRVHLAHINHTADKHCIISEAEFPTGGGSTGAVIGIVIIIIIIIIIVVAARRFYLRWRKNKKRQAYNLPRYQQGHRDDTTSPKPRTWRPTSKRWKKLLGKLVNIADCEVVKVGSFFIGKNEEFLIGPGNNGTEVFLGLTEDGTEVAVKKMTIRCTKALEKEDIFVTFPKLVNPSIIKYVGFAKDENFGYLARQLCEYNLKECIKERMDKPSLSEPERKQLARQFLQSLRFLHGQNPPILHQDIKPENVLIDTNGNARLADFGITQHQNNTSSSNATGMCWLAREILREEDYYTIHSDIQVAGMLIYYILSGGHHPFGDHYKCNTDIGKGNYKLDDVQDVVAKHLIEWMIHADPKQRPTVMQCLDHPFFWSNERRVGYLRGIGKEFVDCPDDDFVTALDQHAEQGLFNSWKLKFSPEMLQKMDGRKSYPDNSFGLLRFIHELYEDAAHIDLLEMFPGLVGAVYKVVQEQDWNSRPALQEIIQQEDDCESLK